MSADGNMYASHDACRVCTNDKRRKQVCKACAQRYLRCRICGVEHLELAEMIGIMELRIAQQCKHCGPSDHQLDFKLLKPKNNMKLKPEDSYMRRRIS